MKNNNSLKDRKINEYLEISKRRSLRIERIRDYFKEQNVLEVDTPVTSISAVSDINIESVQVTINDEPLYLQTSPEFSMKTLLSIGYGDIYQICKVFRDYEKGSIHSPEFTMIEWYRLHFDLTGIIKDTCNIIACIIDDDSLIQNITVLTYQEAFIKFLNIDPINNGISEIQEKYQFDKNLEIQFANDKNHYLDFLLATEICKKFNQNELTVITNYPASQAALAKICADDKKTSERFEVFHNDIEIANGYVELTDAEEICERFQKDQDYRIKNKLKIRPLDKEFIDSMTRGIPSCSGVAVGFDRIHMIAEGKKSLDELSVFSA